ncbi:hypothetical protein KKE60_08215 [Patescibacteria group bacterium]|nr:hypothetical protein [Patescibacteria group bacterium]
MAKKKSCPSGYSRDGTGSCVRPKTVTVYTRGGAILDVVNLPRGWRYEIRDHDNAMEDPKARWPGWREEVY